MCTFYCPIPMISWLLVNRFSKVPDPDKRWLWIFFFFKPWSEKLNNHSLYMFKSFQAMSMGTVLLFAFQPKWFCFSYKNLPVLQITKSAIWKSRKQRQKHKKYRSIYSKKILCWIKSTIKWRATIILGINAKCPPLPYGHRFAVPYKYGFSRVL